MKTVLLIDDEAVGRRLLSSTLEQAGWEVWEATDGEQGISLFRKHRPAVVVTDLLMANVNGFHVISTLRAESSSRHTRLIALSAKSFAADKERALQSGADVFMSKPVRPAEFVLLLEDLIGGPEAIQLQDAPARPAMQVRFWGVRGSVPAPGPATVYYGGNTSCVEVRIEGEIIILDCGTGIR